MSCVHLFQIKPTVATDDLKWSKLISALKSGDGIVSVARAMQHEDPEIAGIAASWKSYEDQKTWSTAKEGKEARVEIETLATGSIYEDVVIFPENSVPTIKAQVVELVSWIHPVSEIYAKREKVADGFAKFQKAISDDAPESDRGLVGGWGQIEFKHDGVASRRFTALIGWKCVEAHYECKKTKPLLDNIHWLMDNDDSGVEVVHYAYSKSLKESQSSL